jgi:hypothetical protein
MSSRLPPNRSPSTPKVSSSSVTGTRKASETQVSWADVAEILLEQAVQHGGNGQRHLGDADREDGREQAAGGEPLARRVLGNLVSGDVLRCHLLASGEM